MCIFRESKMIATKMENDLVQSRIKSMTSSSKTSSFEIALDNSMEKIDIH